MDLSSLCPATGRVSSSEEGAIQGNHSCGGAGALCSALQRDSGGCIFKWLPSLRALEENRGMSLAEVGGAIIGSTVNLSSIRRHAKLKGPGVISQMLAYREIIIGVRIECFAKLWICI